MKVYADLPARRTRQLVGDSCLVVWVLAWVVVARVVHEATMLLAKPGLELTDAGNGMADRLREAGSAVAGAPLVGDQLEAPFTGAGDAADKLAGAGAAQVDAVGHLAFWLSVFVAAVPILLVLAVYVPPRWRFVREASAAQRFIDSVADLDLFALRALSTQPMHRLAAISADPAGAWRRREPETVRRLAELELATVGLHAPPPDAPAL